MVHKEVENPQVKAVYFSMDTLFAYVSLGKKIFQKAHWPWLGAMSSISWGIGPTLSHSCYCVFFILNQ